MPAPLSLSLRFLSLKLSPIASSSAMNKVNKISQIVRLRQVMQRWKTMSISKSSDAGAGDRRIPSGFLAVYVGPERCRFVIPTRFLNLPVFLSLLDKAEEEFGFQSSGGLALPCDVGFFQRLLSLLYRDEQRFGAVELDDFVKMFADVAVIDSSARCKVDAAKNNSCYRFTPLLAKARV